MKFLKALKLGLEVLHCLTCSHNQQCPFSKVARFRNVDYVITVKRKDGE